MINLDYLYNPAAKPRFDKNYFVDKKLGFQVIEHGTILPHKRTPLGGLMGALGGIIDAQKIFIKESFVNKTNKDRSYTPPPLQIKFRKVLRQLFISDIFSRCGDIYLPTIFAAFGFLRAMNLKLTLKIVHSFTFPSGT